MGGGSATGGFSFGTALPSTTTSGTFGFGSSTAPAGATGVSFGQQLSQQTFQVSSTPYGEIPSLESIKDLCRPRNESAPLSSFEKSVSEIADRSFEAKLKNNEKIVQSSLSFPAKQFAFLSFKPSLPPTIAKQRFTTHVVTASSSELGTLAHGQTLTSSMTSSLTFTPRIKSKSTMTSASEFLPASSSFQKPLSDLEKAHSPANWKPRLSSRSPLTVFPPLSELKTRGQAERVENLVITHPEHGSVRFLAPVSLIGVNLDKVVSFRHCEIDLYTF
jgi:hypothetical protein